jgi:hypothetical protein
VTKRRRPPAILSKVCNDEHVRNNIMVDSITTQPDLVSYVPTPFRELNKVGVSLVESIN